MTQKMIDIEVDGRSKKFNSDNIAYLIHRDIGVGFRGYFMIILAFILTIFPSLIILPNLLTVSFSSVLGLILSYVIYQRIDDHNINSMGTINKDYSISNREMDSARISLENMATNMIYVSGNYTTIFKKIEYAYYIDPSSVVSIDRVDRSVPNYMKVLFLSASVLIIGYSSLTYTEAERIAGVTIGMFLLIVTTYYTIRNRPDSVTFEFSNNNEKSILIQTSEAKQIAQHIHNNKDLQEIPSEIAKPKLKSGGLPSELSNDKTDKDELEP